MNTFSEYTFSNGDCEFMAHKDRATGKWVRCYGYVRNMPAGVHKSTPSTNTLFANIDSPLPETFIRSAKARGFYRCD